MIIGLEDGFAPAVDALRRGQVVALPTDTVYGLVALPGDPAAMGRLFALKQRADTKSVAVLVADLEQAQSLTDVALDRFAPWWPGPLTVVVPRRQGVVLHLGGDEATVGIRCPAHTLIRRLARELGPIAATSANVSGAQTLATAAALATAFADVDVVVDGGVLDATPSTVVDATVDPPVLLREGAISATDLGL